jgi:Fic family protein
MAGWVRLTRRLLGSRVEPVIAAAVSAFTFVFIHPFEDGNGRLHRFLIHAILAKQNFSPADIVFPVSAAILRDRRRYDEALEAFSGPLSPFVLWGWTSEQELVVKNDTDDLYRYFDATAQAEYLYDRVAETVRQDLKEELGFAVFDRALAGVRNIVDMPDRRASLFVRLCLQNGGRLAGGRRTTFAELTDAEIAAMEEAVQAAIAVETGQANEPGVGIRT